MPTDVNEKAGEYPFTRGIYPEMYRKRKPTVRQFAGYGLAAETNERFKKIRALGGPQAGLSVAFDLPTLMGLDSDAEICEGQVGWDGVAIDTLDDMEDLFLGIPVDEITVSMTINAPAAVIWAMYIAMAQRRGVATYKLGGTIQNDILKEYIAQKEWLFPEDAGVKLVVDTIEYAAKYLPKWHPISISGYHIREAGATAAQELAFTLADGVEYVRKAIERGLAVDSFAPRLSFFFDAHNNFFEEIAKLRAARRLWAKIMKNDFGAKDPKSLMLKTHVQTAGVSLTRQEPLNNIIRVTIQVLAAMLGGAQGAHANAYDEVFCTPTEDAVKVAIRTQQILQEETGICDFIDPLGGSWDVERLTDSLEAEAEVEIRKIEAMGGMLAAVKIGYPQRMIRESAAKQDQKISSGETTIIGVNKFQSGEIGEPRNVREELALRRGFEERQIQRLSEVKKNRSSAEVRKSLDLVKKDANSGENMMPSLVAAVASYATLGEICGAMQEVFGKYQEDQREFSDIAADQSLRAVAKSYRLPRPLCVLIAKGGLDGHDRVINTMLMFYKKLGAEVIFPGLHVSLKALAKRVLEEDADVVGISTHIGNPVVYFERLRKHLADFGKEDAVVIGGGIITSDDMKAVAEFGVEKFFTAGSSFEEIARFLREVAEKQKSVEPDAAKKMELLFLKQGRASEKNAHIIGVTGSTAVGKSTLINKMIGSLRKNNLEVIVLAVDPTEESSGGAVLGDAIRMRDHYLDPGVFIRSLGSRGGKAALASSLSEIIKVASRFWDAVLVETAGAGQGDVDVKNFVDTLVVLPELRGDIINLLKAGPQEHAHVLAANCRSSEDRKFLALLENFAASFAAAGGGEWKPLVFGVNAKTGEGADALVNEGILKHKEFLKTQKQKSP